MSRERQVSDAFVGLADTLNDDFDVVDLFERLAGHGVALSGVEAAGIMISDGRGRLRAVAASSERAAILELLQLQTGRGPCVECHDSGEPVSAPRIASHRERWPALVPAVLAAGFRAIHTVPLRLGTRTIGAVSLFYAEDDPPADDDMHLMQALADVAAFAMLHWTADRARPADIVERPQATITDKVTLEQAKGVLAQYAGMSIEDAAAVLRAYARADGTRVTDVARRVVRRTTRPHEIVSAPGRDPGGDSSVPVP